MTDAVLNHRLASRGDLEAITAVMERAISELQKPFLTEDQIAASRRIICRGTQLIDDQTYFIVEVEGRIAGCGG